MKLRCWNCGNSLSFEFGDKLTRYDECHQCSADLRTCKMCQFFDEALYNECAESQAERITDKEKANFCGFFTATNNFKDIAKTRQSQLDSANALFKK